MVGRTRRNKVTSAETARAPVAHATSDYTAKVGASRQPAATSLSFHVHPSKAFPKSWCRVADPNCGRLLPVIPENRRHRLPVPAGVAPDTLHALGAPMNGSRPRPVSFQRRPQPGGTHLLPARLRCACICYDDALHSDVRGPNKKQHRPSMRAYTSPSRPKGQSSPKGKRPLLP